MVALPRSAWLMAVSLSVGSLAGCADVLDIPDTSTLSLAPSGPFRCLDAPGQPVLPKTATATVRFQACDFIANCTLPVRGLHARLCDKLDVGCMSPRQVGIEDRGGLLEVTVPVGSRGFDGYLEVMPGLARCYDTSVFGAAAAGLLCQLAPACDLAAPSEACDVPLYSPVLWFFNPPVVADILEPIPLALYPSAALPLVIDAAGGTLAPGTGSVFATVLDCDGKPAPGVSLAIAEYEREASSLYLDSGVISNTASETDASGVGGFIHIPPGFVELTGLDRNDMPVGKVGVQANPVFVTYTVLAPNVVR